MIYPEHLTEELDYELELAVIIGKAGKWFAPEEAMDYVAGYVIFNDITARDIQRREMESGVFSFCKAIDTFCPLGPWIVTPDEIADPHNLAMELRVNGEARQVSHSGRMSVTIPEILVALLGARILGGRRALDGDGVRRRGLLPGRGVALPQARRRDGGRDREHRRAAQPGDLVAGGARRTGASARPLVSWPRDDAKLERVRALMAEQELDALVVRAPDNVLYLTNFWGMKGYDAVVFPREGRPTLICLEASAEDAARNGLDGRPAALRRLRPRRPAAAGAARARIARSRTPRAASGSSSRSARRRATAWSASRRRFRRRGSTRWPDAADAAPLLAQARAIKTEQEIERMRLANEIAAAAMEHVQGVLRPGMTEAQAASEWLGFVHGEGTGWKGQVELALGFSLVWSGPGIKTFTATTDGPIVANEPTLFEIWVCADGYWADHTKNLCPGVLTPEYEELLERAHRRLRRRGRVLHPRARASPSSTGVSVQVSPRRATPASRATRSATASAPARTSRRTRIRRAAARSPRGWCSRSSPASIGRAAAASASRTTS